MTSVSPPNDPNTSLPTRPPELTTAAVVLGIVLSLVMGAANVYLGLRAGMTVSASIPAAVIAMGVLGGIMRRDSLLESNLVQTAASAGESLAAGIIFTMPALILTGIWQHFDYWTTTLIALAGGWLGVLLMVPMRKVFVLGHPELTFPEGLACAEVLRAAEHTDARNASDSGARLVFWGVTVGAAVKFAEGFLGLVRSRLDWASVANGRVLYLGMDLSPALLAVGVIVGLPIASQVFLGGALGWLVAMPLLDTSSLVHERPIDVAMELWSSQIRFMGVGTMVVGGVVSIWRVRRGLWSATTELLVPWRDFRAESDRAALLEARLDDQAKLRSQSADGGDLNGRVLLGFTIASVAIIAALYFTLLRGSVMLTLLTVLVMLVMSFFFTAVASYIVGLVGNSNSPVSGMTITAVLGTAALVYLFGYTGRPAILATLGVAGVVCCVACTSGDVCNDLKTGTLVGASPKKQQMMQLLGVAVGAFVMAPVLTILHEGNAGSGGIGGAALPAPQAGLFATLVEGFFGNGALPWDMIGYGAALGVAMTIVDAVATARQWRMRLHIMPVAVGIYLPFGLATTILLGGLLAHWLGRSAAGRATRTSELLTNERRRNSPIARAVLAASGMIAGESLTGVLLGGLAYLNVSQLDVAGRLGLPAAGVSIVSMLAMFALVVWLLRTANAVDSR